MVTRFANRYRIASIRLPYWNYASPGWYFVTLCTRQRHRRYFGNIIDGIVQLSDMGMIVLDEWLRTPIIRSNITLDAWIIMPDHFHGILVIGDHHHIPGIFHPYGHGVETPRRGVSTTHRWQPNTLGSIINQFKSICTKRIRSIGYPQFQWQPRFYERIIRTPRELQMVRRYIWENPEKWAK
ncbi:MAG: transposase [Candidatus Kerfeldbacteria bacterium]|nr:transposase [Candidatus Kerfeldbacteria bacterium]